MLAKLKNKVGGKTEAQVISMLCIAIVYSLMFWTYLNSIFSILVAVYWLIFSKKHFDISSGKTKLMLLFISLFLVSLAGMLYTSNLPAGIATLKKQSAILLFPLIFGTTSTLNPLLAKKISFHLLIATALSCLAGLFYGLYFLVQTGNTEWMTGKHILPFHVFRPVLMGLFCLLTMVIAFQNITSATGKFKSLLWAHICLMSLMVFLLSIRLVIFCWLLLVLYFLFKNFRLWPHRLLLFFFIIILVLISGFKIPSLHRQWKELFDFSGKSTIVLDRDSSLTKRWGGKALRLAIWQSSGEQLKKHWLTGVGTGDVQDSLQQAYESRKFYFASRYNQYNAHNQYLQITLANGLPGLLILLACICLPLITFRKIFSNDIYFFFLLLFAMISMSEVLFEVNKGILWYSFFNSIFAFSYLKTKEQND